MCLVAEAGVNRSPDSQGWKGMLRELVSTCGCWDGSRQSRSFTGKREKISTRVFQRWASKGSRVFVKTQLPDQSMTVMTGLQWAQGTCFSRWHQAPEAAHWQPGTPEHWINTGNIAQHGWRPAKGLPGFICLGRLYTSKTCQPPFLYNMTLRASGTFQQSHCVEGRGRGTFTNLRQAWDAEQYPPSGWGDGSVGKVFTTQSRRTQVQSPTPT